MDDFENKTPKCREPASSEDNIPRNTGNRRDHSRRAHRF